MNRYYTYAYLRTDGTPYYIGKGQGRRAFETGRHRIKVPPKERILFLKTNLTEAEAFKHEVYMIAVLGRKDSGGKFLRNLTNGGEGNSGWVMPDNLKSAMSKRHKGKTLSLKHLEALRLANLGRSKTDSEIQKIRAKLNRAVTLRHSSGLLLHFSSRKECWSWLGCSRNVLTRLLKGEQISYKEYELD